MNREVLHEGRYLRLVKRDGWEYVERTNARGIVIIIAVTDDGRLILIEQHRVPVGTTVIELPAGLAGDDPGASNEELADAARRELLEETGFEAKRFTPLVRGPSSAGLCTEVVSIFRAHDLVRKTDGGGVEGENISLHLIPLAEVPAWIAAQERRGALIDPKVFAALHFIANGS